MAIDKEMRRLENKWLSNTGWRKRLEGLEIRGIRGWSGQRIKFEFPIVAIVGENGVGKSTILQAAAAIYKAPKNSITDAYFASDFFPDTPWETLKDVSIRYYVTEGDRTITNSIRKPSTRWRGNPARPERSVTYIDLRRSQPIAARTGYLKLAKPPYKEAVSNPVNAETLDRFRSIMGKDYGGASLALSDGDDKRWVSVFRVKDSQYSGFHQGAGEVSLGDFLGMNIPSTGLVLIDEIETSMHPRAQRRLIRDLAERCRQQELQILLTTHSPYILEELPDSARLYVMNEAGTRDLVTGVSPFFAMTKMDDDPHPECDLYVEDQRAAALLKEIMSCHGKQLVQRCQVIPYGAASVGRALGIMVSERRFPRPALVFLDADQDTSAGCHLLPGDESPERVVFDAMADKNWPQLAERVGRAHSEVADACQRAMLYLDHHEWVKLAGDRLTLSGDILWQALCSTWAVHCLDETVARRIIDQINDCVNNYRTRAGVAE